MVWGTGATPRAPGPKQPHRLRRQHWPWGPSLHQGPLPTSKWSAPTINQDPRGPCLVSPGPSSPRRVRRPEVCLWEQATRVQRHSGKRKILPTSGQRATPGTHTDSTCMPNMKGNRWEKRRREEEGEGQEGRTTGKKHRFPWRQGRRCLPLSGIQSPHSGKCRQTKPGVGLTPAQHGQRK